MLLLLYVTTVVTAVIVVVVSITDAHTDALPKEGCSFTAVFSLSIVLHRQGRTSIHQSGLF